VTPALALAAFLLASAVPMGAGERLSAIYGCGVNLGWLRQASEWGVFPADHALYADAFVSQHRRAFSREADRPTASSAEAAYAHLYAQLISEADPRRTAAERAAPHVLRAGWFMARAHITVQLAEHRAALPGHLQASAQALEAAAALLPAPELAQIAGQLHAAARRVRDSPPETPGAREWELLATGITRIGRHVLPEVERVVHGIPPLVTPPREPLAAVGGTRSSPGIHIRDVVTEPAAPVPGERLAVRLVYRVEGLEAFADVDVLEVRELWCGRRRVAEDSRHRTREGAILHSSVAELQVPAQAAVARCELRLTVSFADVEATRRVPVDLR
jgi:hypothetical protein